ncbi:glycosyl hydrolase family 18 protein [Vibrio neonatus]|uniref:glycosyl hydrolase family 18 protein n=1 Tax=Vibrio neonatus TaxID=278860 RepID=UPI0021C26FA0|nr:glycosyl hydrolase family 18 protein [Vibrio neonatus]
MFNKSFLSLSIIGSIFAAPTFAAAPGEPVLSWGDHTYAMVEVDPEAVAYQKVVKAVHTELDIEVTWDVWTGDPADTARVLLDGNVVWEGDASANKAVFKMNKGGLYDMAIELENADGVSRSKTTLLTIADTDGSHIEPLETVWTENNKPYENTTDKIVGTYVVEWAVYGRDYPIDKAPIQNLNRMIYGFVPMCGGHGLNDSLKTIEGSFEALQNACAGREDFKVAIHDPWAAVQIPLKGSEEWSAPYKGNFAQMMAAKKANPDLRILPSIGGWTLSDPFFFMHDDEIRHTFVESVREYLETWKFFDGVDIDYEFPGGGGANPNLGNKDIDGQTYVTLMKDLREMLDELGEKNGRYYELGSAINIGHDKLAVVDYGEASKYLDHIFLMSYDYYGAWNTSILNHQAALHKSGVNTVPDESEYYTSRGVEILLEQGVPIEKMVIGGAAYGRGWSGVHGFTDGNPFTGNATGPINGTWENGVLDYRDIAENHGAAQGFVYGYDEAAEAPYLFKESTGELITYDDPRSIKAKAQYALANGMAGIFHWEMDGDNGDLINAMHEGLGHGDSVTDPEQPNRAPIARAGVDKTVTGPASVTLDGSLSSDPEGEALTFSWQQTGGNAVTIINNTSAKPTVDVPFTEADVSYTFTLTVADPDGASSSDSVVITNTAEVTNQPPTIAITPTVYVDENAQFTLLANAADADGDSLAYTWNVPSDFVIIDGGHENSIVLTAPEVAADTQFSIDVTVTDGEESASATTRVHVANIEEDNGGDDGDTDGGEGDGGDSGDGDTDGGNQCSSTDPAAPNYPAWEAGNTYTNETVSHKGLVYKAKWWTQAEPSPTAEGWELISEIELPWSAAIAYAGTEQTNHNGSRWQAKWWTQGDEPGVEDVWVNLGSSTCKY